MTCLSAIENGCKGSIQEPINHSKGCGGIMRVAPIGLYYGDKWLSVEQADKVGAEVAALTHGHELGYLPAAVLVHIVYRLATSEVTILEAVEDAAQTVAKLFPATSYMQQLLALIRKAQRLAQENLEDLEAIHQLGEGWVAEETLAIALYCALKYPHDFDKAIVASVNHRGDSDSTGAVTGNILGTYLGLQGIPAKYITHLELKDLILEVVDDLYNDCRMEEYDDYYDPIWDAKYIKMTYRRTNMC